MHPHPPAAPRIGRALVIVLVAWATAVAAVTWRLNTHDELAPQSTAPLASRARLPESEFSCKPWTLILGVHPQCPCTSATVSELERLLARTAESMRCVAYVLASPDDEGFTKSRVTERLRAIPGVECRDDFSAETATRLGLQVSGEAVLYDRLGEPRFAGGLTPARGHEGHNLGLQSIEALVRGGSASVETSPAYGCKLVSN